MNILEACDLTGSYRGAAQLCGVSHHTVALHVARRDAGVAAGGRPPVDRVMDAWRDKLAEWVAVSKGRIRADRAHDKLVALGYGGSERTTRREVADAKAAWDAGHGRVCRPWTPEPGLWFQYDYGTGPDCLERSLSQPAKCRPACRGDRFPSSTQEPEPSSRHLQAGHHPGSKQVSPGLIPR